MPSHQFNSKNSDPVLLFNWFKTVCRHWNCFLSSVATDGKDRRGLKLKTPGPTSSFNAISGCKIPPRKLLWFKWFLMKLCYIFFTTLQEHFVYWYTLSNDFSIELIPKVAISSWPDSPFKTCDHLLKISFVVDRWTFWYWRCCTMLHETSRTPPPPRVAITTIFRATKRSNIVATLFRTDTTLFWHYNAVMA